MTLLLNSRDRLQFTYRGRGGDGIGRLLLNSRDLLAQQSRLSYSTVVTLLLNSRDRLQITERGCGSHGIGRLGGASRLNSRDSLDQES